MLRKALSSVYENGIFKERNLIWRCSLILSYHRATTQRTNYIEKSYMGAAFYVILKDIWQIIT